MWGVDKYIGEVGRAQAYVFVCLGAFTFMGKSYDDFSKSLKQERVGDTRSDDSYNEMKRRLSGEHNSSKFSKVAQKSKSSAGRGELGDMFRGLIDDNKYMVFGVGILIIIALVLLIYSVSIHHVGGHGVITSIVSPGNGDSKQDFRSGAKASFMLSDGSKMDLMYAEGKDVTLLYTANEGDVSIIVERLVYKDRVGLPELVAKSEVNGDKKVWSLPLVTTGWNVGVPLKITKLYASGEDATGTYMVRLKQIGMSSGLVISKQSV